MTLSVTCAYRDESAQAAYVVVEAGDGLQRCDPGGVVAGCGTRDDIRTDIGEGRDGGGEADLVAPESATVGHRFVVYAGLRLQIGTVSMRYSRTCVEQRRTRSYANCSA